MEDGDWERLERLMREAELDEEVKEEIRSIARDECDEEVEFVDENLGPKSAQALALALKGTTTVRVLNLWENQIGEAGARALAEEGLKHVPSLQVLRLNDNQIGVSGARALVEEGLKHVPSLRWLDLYGTQIGEAGARALAEEGLKHVPSLWRLDMRHNGLTEDGMVEFLKCLQANPPKCKIRVNDADLRDSAPVARALATLRHLQPEAYIRMRPFNSAAYQQQLDLLNLLETGSVPLDTAKVFVCGDYGIGKTTLVTTLEQQRHLAPEHQPPDEPTKPDERTAGIHVRPLQLQSTTTADIDDEPTPNFQVYDFGGQTAYHVVHTLLVSDHNAAFVVCADLSKSKDEVKTSIRRWLRFLCTRLQQGVEAITEQGEGGQRQQHDKRPHVVLVGTKADKPHESNAVDTATGKLRWFRAFVKRLRNAFGKTINLTADSILPLNCFRGQDAGFDQLRSELLDHWRWLREKQVLVPKVVEEVGTQLDRIREETETPMRKEQLQQRLEQDVELLADIKGTPKALELFGATLRYLHVRGDVLWFSDNPALADLIFVSPNWLLNIVMGRALAPEGVECDGVKPESGVVTYTDIDVTFEEHGVPADLVINVLQYSHLCFELPPNKSDERQFMLPSRLEEEVRDVTTVWQKKPGWPLYAGRRLLIEHKAFALPPGLFPCVMTQLYQEFGGALRLWRNAFKLTVAGVQCFGLLRGDREIDVWIRAKRASDNARVCLDLMFRGLEAHLRDIPYEIHAVSVEELKQHLHHPASYKLASLLKMDRSDYAASDYPPSQEDDPLQERVGELLFLNQTQTEHVRDIPWHADGFEWWHNQWRLHDDFDKQLQWTGPGPNKVYTAPLPTDSDLHRWIASQVNKGHGVTLSRVEIVKSATMLGAFKFRVQQMAERRGDAQPGNDFNKDAWKGKPGKADMVQHLKQQFCSTDAQHVNVLPLWHGCSEAVVDKIIAAGTANLSGPADPGFFGTGIYLTQQAPYAAGYASKLAVKQWAQPNDNGEHVLLLCAVSVGLAYPITRQGDYPAGVNRCDFYGQKLHRGCDTHYAQVTRASGFQATETPGSFNFEEVVVSQEAQVLPFAKVYVNVNRDRLKHHLRNPPTITM